MANKYLKNVEKVEDYSNMTATEAVLARLKSKNPKTRREAIESLGNIKTKKVVHILIKALNDPAWTNRQIAAESLIKIGSIAIESIIAILDDEHEDTHYWAIEILGRLGGAGIDALTKILGSPNREDRLHVVRCIHKSGDSRVIAPLVKALGDDEWAIRKHAAEGIELFGEKSVPLLQKAFQSNLNPMGNDDICFWSIKILGKILREKAIPVFIDLLRNKDKNIRFYAVGALGETRCEMAVTPLIEALSDSSWLVRKQAFEMLEMVGEYSVDQLKNAFFKGNDDIKYWSVRLIGKILKGESVEILKKLLNTQEKDIRYFVVTALGETGDPKALPTLINCLKDNYWQIRKQACDMISNMKILAIPSLEKALKSDSEDIRYWSVRALGKIAGPAKKILFEVKNHPNNRMRLFSIYALSEIGTDDVIEPIIESLGDQSWPVRNAAGEALEKIGAKAMYPLIKAIGSESDDISFWAQKVLSNFGDKAVQSLIDGLNDKENPDMRKFSIIALGKIATAASLQPLIEIIQGQVVDECELVVEALGDIKDPVLVNKLLIFIAENEDERVADWIAKILTNIGEAGRPVFFKSIKSESKNVRYWTARILGTFEGNDIIRALVFMLKDRDVDVRVQAILSLDGLEKPDDKVIVPYIITMLNDPELAVRSEAYKVLGKIGEPQSINKLVQRFVAEDDDSREKIISIFQQIETSNLMISFLAAIDECSDENVRESIITVIRKICDSPVKRDILIKTLSEENLQSAIWGIHILSDWEDEVIADGIIRLLKSDNDSLIIAATNGLAKYLTSGNWVIRDKASEALTKKGTIIIKALLSCTDKQDDFKKMNVFQIIENMGDAVIPILQELIDEKDSKYSSLSLELFTSLQKSSRIGGRPKVKEEENKKKKGSELEDIMARMKLK